MSTLVIAVRGWSSTGDWLLFGRPGAELTPQFAAALQQKIGGVEVWCPELEMGIFSMCSPEDLAQELYARIDRRLGASPQIRSVVLLGFSAGSLIARRVFCLAHGAAVDGSVSLPPAPWAGRIDRMVILSGITRGWEFSSASPAHVRFLAPALLGLATLVGRLKLFFGKRTPRPDGCGGARTPFIWQLMRGSPFVISTRLQYVNVLRRLKAQRVEGLSGAEDSARLALRSAGIPSTVFLLGARDEFVSPADCTELGPRAEFVYIELPGSNHAEAIQISDGSAPANLRLERLAAATAESFADLGRRDWAVRPEDIDDYLDPMDISGGPGSELLAREQVGHAVMVVHGIRDDGFWTKRVAREIKRLGRQQELAVRAPTPTYGYFSMWDFVQPGGRERATRWFMERYADVRTHFPEARVSFVGHSNGTYIAARALELSPAIQFEQVVFAGSVVRCSYRWDRVDRQVKRVLNYVGGGDGVVAFLPAVFEVLRWSWLDVGGAGAFGFRPKAAGDGVEKCGELELHEVRFVRGGHGAAIDEPFWPEIARFALLGEPPKRTPQPRSWTTRVLFRAAPVVTLTGIVVAAGLLLLPVFAPSLWLLYRKTPTVAVIHMLAVAALGVAGSWAANRFVRRW